jgi:undecaprenyl-diphosphatase
VTLITGVVGILGKTFFESLFSLPRFIGFALLVNGMILILSGRFISANRGMNAINVIDAICLGLAQALAIIPGISRSGITISTLLLRKIEKESAFKFSFLAAIPAIVGAWLLEARGQISVSAPGLINLFLCFLFSFFSGILGLRLLRLVLLKTKLHYFGYYCLLAGTVSIIFFK